jgi:hypothetical protein
MRRATMIFCCLLAVAMAGCGGSTATGGRSSGPPSGGAGATVVAGATVAAGSSGTPASVGSLPAACSLLAKTEIEGVVGHPLMDGTGSGKDCQWQRTDPHQISVALHVLALPGTLGCQTAGGTPITDLGVEAAWHYLPNLSTGSVTACTAGRIQAQISLVGDLVTHTTTEDQLRTAGVALMRLVLPRL